MSAVMIITFQILSAHSKKRGSPDDPVPKKLSLLQEFKLNKRGNSSSLTIQYLLLNF